MYYVGVVTNNIQARVQEFVRGKIWEPFFLLFNFSGGGGPAQKIAEKMIIQNIGEIA